MAARVIHGFGSGVCEALPVQLVNDIFFLHERGKRIGYYTGTPDLTRMSSSSTDIDTSLPMLRFHRAAIRRLHARWRLLLAIILLRRLCLRHGPPHLRLFRCGRNSVQACDTPGHGCTHCTLG